VAVEAETQRYLRAGPRHIPLGRDPASTQRRKHIADGIQVMRRASARLLPGRHVGRGVFCPTDDGQLQGLTYGVVDVGYAGLMAEDAAIGAVRDARTAAKHAAGIRTVQRREKHTFSKDMNIMPEDVKVISEVKVVSEVEAMPERTQILIGTLRAGITNRGPCRNPEYDRGAGGKSPKQAVRHLRYLRSC